MDLHKDMKRIKLNVYGLSYDSMTRGSYSLLLKEDIEDEDSARILPIAIGGFESQAIAIALEKVAITRPLTHDLIKNIFDRLEISLKEVIIHKFKDGIFYSLLILSNDMEVDSRTSDAIALAVRYECPVYTYDDVLSKGGYLPNEEKKNDAITIEELEDEMKKAIEIEDYERAGEIRDQIKKLKENNG